MDCRWPQQVVSILCTPTTAYVGVSATEDNRSAWPGGKHRFKRDDDQVSRAEFKLLEAMSVFGFEFPAKGRALDIGASPGGWTRVLAARGLEVDAVDPGDLDPRLRNQRGVRHFRRRIQEYSPKGKEFAAIVNDMKMDARDSVEIMLGFAPYLAAEGTAVMTLKLPKMGGSATAARKMLDMLREDLERLATGYEVIGARQLYHNRSEVTVALRRP
jgi:23S rRNA (cytidine2498-2'-O)-methyltransferase